jgi:maltose alpha-D-glucosyltransferase/alpha-amylase
LLVAMNFSRFTQCVDLDLSSVRDRVPVELFGRTRFPAIGKEPYRLTFGPHDFFWFSLEAGTTAIAEAAALPPPLLAVREHWSELLQTGPHRALDGALGNWVARARWFRAKSKAIRLVAITDSARLAGEDDSRLAFVDVTLGNGDTERYVTAFSGLPGENAEAIVLARNDRAETSSLVDTSRSPHMADKLVELLYSGTTLPTLRGELVPRPAKLATLKDGAPTRLIDGDHTNTCYSVRDTMVVKLLRKLEEGPSVEVEMLRELEPHASELQLPSLYGSLELVRPRQAPVTIASFVEYVPNQGDAWHYVLDEVHRYFDQVLALGNERTPPAAVPMLGPRVAHELAVGLVGGPLEAARVLGRRTGELHRALGESTNPDFERRPFNDLARRAVYQSIRSRAVRAFDSLEQSLPRLSPELLAGASALCAKRQLAHERLRALLDTSPAGSLIRVHGDFHLGQVLYTGKDFAIIDFEGEPGRTLEERRRRRSPLVDVAGLLRSYHYAVASVLRGDVPVHGPRELDVPRLMPWARAWTGWVCHAFVEGYLHIVAGTGLVPDDFRALEVLLDVFLLEKAFYELAYELDNRPHWVGIPLAGLSELLCETGAIQET